MNVDILYLEITNQCNFLCKHCQNSSGILAEEIIDVNDFEYILSFFLERGLETLNITGGEPTVHPDFPYILECAAQKNIKVNLLTNGYYVDRYMELIYKYRRNVFVQISLDGYDRESFYKIRNNYKFNSIIKNIRLLKERGIDVRIKSTLTKDNMDFYKKYIDLAVSLDCPIKFNFLNPVGRGKSLNQLCLGYEDIVLFDKSVMDPEERKCIPTIDEFFPPKCSVLNYSESIKVIKITSAGYVYPCIGFREEWLSLGNYRKDTLESILKNIEKLKKGIVNKISEKECLNCEGLDNCHKTCVLSCDYFEVVCS